MSPEMTTAPEIVIPEQFVAAGEFSQACPTEVNDLYTKIWTELQK